MLPSTRMQKVKKESSSEGLVKALECDLAPFSCHLFNARQQFHQYKLVTSDLPLETVISCMDFVRTSHAGLKMLHRVAIVAPTSALSVRIQAQLSQTRMSSSAVICSMTTMLCSILLERLLNCCLVKMSCLTVIQFSDGASTQYKSRISFVDCSHSVEDHGIQSERHFFWQ